MDEGFIFTVLAFCVVAAMIWMAQKRAKNREAHQAMRALAQYYRGSQKNTGWTSLPEARIPYGRTSIFVTIGPAENGRTATRALIHWPEFATHTVIYAYAMGRRSHAHLQGAFRLGDREWDENFRVIPGDGDYARTLLTGGVRSAIIMLSRIRPNGYLNVRFGQGSLLVEKLTRLEQPAELIAFVRHTMELFDQAILARTAGIEFVEHLDLQPLDDARCPVCGEEIVSDIVFCVSCRTPHHRDCWNYNGKCATYACGEIRAVPLSPPR